MCVVEIAIEHSLDVSIERPHHADTRMLQEVPAFGGANQASNGCLPFNGPLLGLRQLHDVVGGILERDELITARQRKSGLRTTVSSRPYSPSGSKPFGRRGGLSMVAALQRGHGAPAPPQVKACGPSHS
jgi:hypothetical protein